MRLPLALLGLLLLLEPVYAGGRRVYVLHSGVHIAFNPVKNRAAETLKQRLVDRGIPARDIVVLDNPFPTATWTNILPRESLVHYLDSMSPTSAASQEAYVRLHEALKRAGVTADDRLVWVGHSAGGQVGMTMAHLAHHLDRYADLTGKAAPYRFDTVITLGTAVGANPVPPEVKLRHYHSPGDRVVGLLFRSGDELASGLGYTVRFCPGCDLGDNAKVRVFDGIDHHAWYRTDAVIDCILREHAASAWHGTTAEARAGAGLAGLLCQALDAECGVSFEGVGRR